ncbi:MAG: transglutaminase domain-containing protein [Candidatus Asgardarchaeia archaeon]
MFKLSHNFRKRKLFIVLTLLNILMIALIFPVTHNTTQTVLQISPKTPVTSAKGESMLASPKEILSSKDSLDVYLMHYQKHYENVKKKNGTVPVALYTNDSDSIRYYIVSTARIYNNKVIYENPNISSNDNVILSGTGVQVTPIVPSYWTRGSTIAIKVRFDNNNPTPFTYSGYIYCYIKDLYIPYIYETTEASGQKYASFTIGPYSYKYVYVYVNIGYRMVGLKKVVVDVTGTLSLHFDLGYNFVQQFKRSEVGNPTLVDSNEDVYELSDLHHHNQWSVIKKAGEAGDYPFDIRYTLYDVMQRVEVYMLDWVHYHFVYDEAILPEYIAVADLWIMSHEQNGKYHGVCDEYTTIYVSFSRALNIPARYIYSIYKCR